jgi:hypothetical protein
MQIAAEKIVIFDYSGTLSIEAPEFGKPDNLVRALEKSGLAAVGITDAEIFWNKIVFPTWDEGTRTPIGYAGVIADRIASLHLFAVMPPQGAAPSCGHEIPFSSILKAASSFVAMYLNHSPIDPRWRPLLEKLNACENISVVIATDHYAEATDAIVRYLGDWGIAATKAAKIENGEAQVFADKKGQVNPVIVANSADLGFWKAEQRFWELLKSRLPGRSETILIVDDFGFNEADANGYGRLSDVRARRLKTKAALREVFGANVSTVSFFLNKNEGNNAVSSSKMIRKTERRIEAAVQLYREQAPLITVAH